MIWSSRFWGARQQASFPDRSTDLEALVLQHLLDRHVVVPVRVEAALHQTRLEHDPERAVPDDLAVGVANLARLARLAVRGDHLDQLLGVVRCTSERGAPDGAGTYARCGSRSCARPS